MSVVMSVYNNSETLRESIESILGQRNVRFEFIIVDDASQDESLSIVKEYRTDKRVRLVCNDENIGLTRSLVRGCSEARGEYIARQDADDISMPERLTELAELLDQDERIVMASSWSRCINDSNDILYEEKRTANPEEATRQLLEGKVGPPGHGSVVFRKNAYEKSGGYREEFYFGQDSDLWFRLCQHGMLGYVQSYLYNYRHNEGGISVVHGENQYAYGEITKACHHARMNGKSEEPYLEKAARLREMIIEGGEEGASKRSMKAGSYYFQGSGLYERGDVNAKKYLFRAVKAHPLHWRAWTKLLLSLVRNS